MKKRKSYTVSIPVKTFWLVFLPLCLLLGGGGALGGFYVVDRHVMPRIVGVHRDMVAIPSVQGKSFEDAREAFFAIGLRSEVRGREFSEEVPEGSVIEQYPEAGEKVKKGRRISVTVSRGAEVATIPYVRRMTETQARNELRRSGFTVGSIRRTFAPQPPDMAIETSPPGGTTTSRAVSVDIILSRGPRPTHAEVPNVIGENLSEARRRIADAGLNVGRVTTQVNAALAPGTIASQSVAPGSKIPFEGSVDLVVSATR
ncbi:MAG: PASTA domain-containing protein [Chitinispirillales bacterium]|nr:PASTA domain-containing protein [Chitinispirillales bacterium]